MENMSTPFTIQVTIQLWVDWIIPLLPKAGVRGDFIESFWAAEFL